MKAVLIAVIVMINGEEGNQEISMKREVVAQYSSVYLCRNERDRLQPKMPRYALTCEKR